MDRRHVLLVTFPAQGHINPSLQFAKRLMGMGIEVTFSTSVYAQRRIAKASSDMPKGLTFASFSDGYDDGFKMDDDGQQYMTEIKNRGSTTLRGIIHASAQQGRPVTYLVYTLLLPWAADVARDLNIPNALLWIQPAMVLDIYYYYFHGYEDEIKKCSDDPSWSVQFPGLPLLLKHDLPSFILPSSSDKHSYVLPTFKEQLNTLEEETRPKVLVNTFDALEPDALNAIQHYELIGIGPLIPSAFLDGKDTSDRSFGGDLFQKSDDYIEWLGTKPESSVVYVSFGSLLKLPMPQMEEIAKGLLASGRPFLWVIRTNENSQEEGKEEDHKLSCLEELENLGKIVPWCSQLEVLTHPSLGCFVTHCGWNSTLESISCGVPVVAFPQWTDQGTNAKLIQDVCKTGVRVTVNEHGIVESEEVTKCIEAVMDGGEKSLELRENARKWRDLAREAAQENGSSYKNLKAFFSEAGEAC